MPSKRSSIARHALLSLTFVLLYLLLNRPEIILISHFGTTAWYPANGLVLSLLLSISPWYGLLVGLSDVLASSVIYQKPLLSFGTLLGAFGIAACYSFAAVLLRGPLRIDSSLSRGRDVVRYVSVALAAALGSTAIGVSSLLSDHAISRSEIWSAAADWFMGDGIGLLGFAPFLLIHIFPAIRKWLEASPDAPAQAPKRRQNLDVDHRSSLEVLAQGAALLLVLWVMFGPHWARLELFYLSFIPVLWIAMRSGIRGIATGILCLNFGIVIAMHFFPPTPALLAKLGPLMLVVSASGLIVGAVVTERQRLDAELNQRTTYLNSLIENSPLGIVVLGSDGRVELVNDAFAKLSLYEQKELVGHDLDSVFLPDASGETGTPGSSQAFAGDPGRRTLRRRRKDGKILDLELHTVPLAIDGQVQGAYAICRDISEQIKAAEAEREHTQSLNRLVKELELQTHQMTILNEMASLLECCTNTREACAVVAQSARKLFPELTSGALYTFRASRNLVEAVVSWGEPGRSEQLFAPESCWALRRGQLHWSNPKGDGVPCPHLEGTSAGKHLCLPMVGQGETLGVLHLEFPTVVKEDSTFYSSRERLGATVAGQVALSLASLQLRETLRDQSIRDPLTGLFNRRFMQESLEKEMMRARRKNHSIALVCLDIDHFKRFNDTFGHDAGDFVLRTLADLLRGFFRGDDIACRCGGEEFAMILPESNSRNATLRADQLRTEVKRMNLRHRDVPLGEISVSIGVAAFPEHSATAEELLKVADQCLYRSKSDGRDRVTVAAE